MKLYVIVRKTGGYDDFGATCSEATLTGVYTVKDEALKKINESSFKERDELIQDGVDDLVIDACEKGVNIYYDDEIYVSYTFYEVNSDTLYTDIFIV